LLAPWTTQSTPLQLTQVVDHDEKGGTEHGSKQSTAPNIAVHEDARRHRGILLLPPLNHHKANREQTKQDQQDNDAGALPRVLASAPLQREQQADDGRQKQSRAVEIKLLELLPPCRFRLLAPAVDLEKWNDEGRRDSAEGQVDVETPAPSQVVGKSSTHLE
jgi:hypothetical protein